MSPLDQRDKHHDINDPSTRFNELKINPQVKVQIQLSNQLGQHCDIDDPLRRFAD